VQAEIFGPRSGYDRPRSPIEVIAAIHHPARRRIMDYLSLESPATVSTIASALGLQVGSVSPHLKAPEQAKRRARSGRLHRPAAKLVAARCALAVLVG
jgi:DNA-binding transcriptional ArsR family regulator